MEVVDQIRQGDKIVKATLVSGGKLVKEIPRRVPACWMR